MFLYYLTEELLQKSKTKIPKSSMSFRQKIITSIIRSLTIALNNCIYEGIFPKTLKKMYECF